MKPNATPGFRITDSKGFHVTFENGFTVSVQFGGGNYCDNYDNGIGGEQYRQSGECGSRNAECAAWGPDGEFVQLPGEEGSVTNRSRPADVLRFLHWAAEQPRPAPAHTGEPK